MYHHSDSWTFYKGHIHIIDTSVTALIACLADIEAIRTLTHSYALAISKGWVGKSISAASIAAVFTDDATWVDAARNVSLNDAAAIGAALADTVAGLDLAMHSFSNPVIAIDGDRASGNWLLWVAVGAGGTVSQVFQAEDLAYQRGPDGWRIASIALHAGAMMT